MVFTPSIRKWSLKSTEKYLDHPWNWCLVVVVTIALGAASLGVYYAAA
jgi:hypothetical protein